MKASLSFVLLIVVAAAVFPPSRWNPPATAEGVDMILCPGDSVRDFYLGPPDTWAEFVNLGGTVFWRPITRSPIAGPLTPIGAVWASHGWLVMFSKGESCVEVRVLLAPAWLLVPVGPTVFEAPSFGGIGSFFTT